jgi:hypothetical protein
MNSAGNVRWRTQLPRPILALEFDPLGRYLIYGHGTGEIVRLDLFAGGESRSASQAAGGLGAKPVPTVSPAIRTTTGSVRVPDWIVPAVQTDQQSETAVLAVADNPPMIASFTSPHRLQLFDLTGQRQPQGPDMTGVGRILRTAPGWLAAATDRQILLCDLKRQTQRRLDVSLVEVTHLAISPDDFGLALVQERDRIGRLTASSRWVWKRELQAPVEELAIGPHGFAAVTTHAGQLMVFDPAGEPIVGFTFDPTDPPLVIEAPTGAPASVAWLTLSRRAQFLRGHDLHGRVQWERSLPWEGWSLLRLDRLALATAADGRAFSCDGTGSILEHSGPSSGSNDVFCIDASGTPLRISRRGVHLICAALDGRVRWRAVVDQSLGPHAAAAPGIAVLFGRSLAWFKNESIATD